MNPSPKDHLVYPYTDENLFVEAVSVFAEAGLRKNEGVILIMTDAHRQATEKRLTTDGFNIENEADRGHLTFLSAETLLSRFLRGGTPDATLFKNVVGTLIERTRITTGRKIRLFGEMVSLLFGANDA